ncbi:MAG: 30S ribosome-binding factor RbfA [Bacteroidia bacterium]|nr:30S ribosome-binding factor RbfA [Bacteroidia bacterium]
MESKRQQKNSRMLLRELGTLFQHNFKEITGKAFITITDVKVTPDLKQAKVYLSFLNEEDQDKTLNNIQQNSWIIRRELAQKIRNQVKYIPELMFHLDETREEAARIEQLFKDLNIPPETNS